MRVALISDIHGNEVALRAVLEEIEDDGIEQIVCLGDVATLGPRPARVLDLIESLNCPCIMGNHDEFLLDEAMLHEYSDVPLVVDAVKWCSEQIEDHHRDFLRTFKSTHEIDLGDGSSLLLFHGSPESHMQDLLCTTPSDELDRHLAGRRATVLAGGHTHIQMLRQHRGMLLVNPGSVGMPFEEFVRGTAPTILPYAEYAVVEAEGGRVRVDLRRVNLNKIVLQDAVRGWDMAIGQDLYRQYA